MSLEVIAQRYAEALYEIGVEQSNLPVLTKDFDKLGSVYADHADLRNILGNPLVAEEEQTALLKDLGRRLGTGSIANNTVGLLAQRNRLVLLPYIARGLKKLADDKAGIERATVTTAARLPETFYEKLKRQLESSTGKKIVLERKVDPELLGGVVTRVGDKVIDGSVRSRLGALKSQLLA